MGVANTGRLRLAVVGCGAVTELFHMPVIAAAENVELTLLVDRDTDRAAALAERCGGVAVSADYRDVAGRADAAIVAVPHHLHAQIAVELMHAGVDVLVEKPMAGTVQECDAMIEASEDTGRILAIGMQRRFSNGAQLVKDVLDSGMLGSVSTLDLREGAIYGWPAKDTRMFEPGVGGGVVTGSGIHSLDLLLWWMGEAESVSYSDDAMGGVEADCEFTLDFPSGSRAMVEFSRTRALRNTWIIRGESASLEIGVGPQPSVTLTPTGGKRRLAGVPQLGANETETPWTLLERQLEDFAQAVQTRREPLVSGKEGRRAIAAMEVGQANRRLLTLPWLLPSTMFGNVRGTTEGVRAHA